MDDPKPCLKGQHMTNARWLTIGLLPCLVTAMMSVFDEDAYLQPSVASDDSTEETCHTNRLSNDLSSDFLGPSPEDMYGNGRLSLNGDPYGPIEEGRLDGPGVELPRPPPGPEKLVLHLHELSAGFCLQGNFNGPFPVVFLDGIFNAKHSLPWTSTVTMLRLAIFLTIDYKLYLRHVAHDRGLFRLLMLMANRSRSCQNLGIWDLYSWLPPSRLRVVEVLILFPECKHAAEALLLKYMLRQFDDTLEPLGSPLSPLSIACPLYRYLDASRRKFLLSLLCSASMQVLSSLMALLLHFLFRAYAWSGGGILCNLVYFVLVQMLLHLAYLMSQARVAWQLWRLGRLDFIQVYGLHLIIGILVAGLGILVALDWQAFSFFFVLWDKMLLVPYGDEHSRDLLSSGFQCRFIFCFSLLYPFVAHSILAPLILFVFSWHSFKAPAPIKEEACCDMQDNQSISHSKQASGIATRDEFLLQASTSLHVSLLVSALGHLFSDLYYIESLARPL